MSKPIPETDPRIINHTDRVPDWDEWDERVRKIVVGPTPGQSDAKPLDLAELPENLATRFPNLTHLYLWQLKGLRSLPTLPAKLQCLDLRGCEDLAELPALPATLETLVLDGCTSLAALPVLAPGSLPVLVELSLKGCVKVPEGWIHRALTVAQGLRSLDVSACPQMEGVPEWPLALERIELNDCKALEALPGEWPPRLRRVGLRGASAVTAIPDSPSGLDYLDLAHTEALRELPAELGKPRTLFLFGSGVRKPPASEHGKDANENVAIRTRAYFDDVALVGKGRVKRCKLLMLGNGGAGKTCLSLALMPGGDPADAEKIGTTHGVQFWDWPFRAKAGGAYHDVHLHLWDFGGQEIYHNTHRLFMSKGAVFVVVWKPEQDSTMPEKAECGYQDEWRRVQYWLDFIHLACPDKPRIAIVCSHHAQPTDALKAQLRSQLRPESCDERQWFFVDSLHRAGELDALKKWLAKEVGGVVESQGVEVPTYWEIAQDMVQGWVRRMEADPAFAEDHNHLHPDRFREALYEAMQAAIVTDLTKRYARLKEARDSGDFELIPSRVERTLAFLTHSGWVYWDKNLFQGQVIVGQKWALDGIYAVLERRKDSTIFRALNQSDGRFTLSQLGKWAWDGKGYSLEAQKLLRSFMEQCGLCFKLRARAEAWREEDVYVSFEHLPTAETLRFQRTFNTRRMELAVDARTIDAPRMHKQHWQAFLTDAGSHYGKDARYALDGFYLESEEGQKVLVLCYPEAEGLGGHIDIQVCGPSAGERLGSVEAHLKRFLPGSEEGGRPDHGQTLGKRASMEEVFISYAWNPPARDGESGIPPGYEEPVDAIEAFLKDKPVILIRDKNVTKFGDNLKRFMEYGAKRPHVIVVHSDKYWRSPFCIFELWMVDQELRTQEGKSLMNVVIPVEHLSSGITTVEGLRPHLAHWAEFTGTPRMLGWDPEELKDHAKSLLWTFSSDLNACLDLNLRWSDGPAKVLTAIAERLGLGSSKKSNE